MAKKAVGMRCGGGFAAPSWVLWGKKPLPLAPHSRLAARDPQVRQTPSAAAVAASVAFACFMPDQPRKPPSWRRALLPCLLVASAFAATPVTAQTAADATPTLTAGPDDLMRILPPQLLAGLQPVCSGGSAHPAWSAQIDAIVALLYRLNQAVVPPQDAALPAAVLCAPQRAVGAALRRAAQHASNLVLLDFPGAPRVVQPHGEDAPAVVGASFIGPHGSRVLVVNRGTQPVRVVLGSWIGKSARLDQYTAPDAHAAAVRHLRRALGPQDAHGIWLAPLSLSVIG